MDAARSSAIPEYLLVDAGDEFDRVREHLAHDPLLEFGRTLSDIGEENLGGGCQIKAVSVQQSQFPFDSKGGAG